jgi:hypothetical protein
MKRLLATILGDLFDTTWKANTKNVNLLETLSFLIQILSGQ